MMQDWLKQEVVSGLQALIALRLNGAPAADTVVLTAEIWQLAFHRHLGKSAIEEIDAPRIREAFESQFPKLREWPAPAAVIAAMPPRPPRPALPVPDVTPEQHQANVTKVKHMLADLVAGWRR